MNTTASPQPATARPLPTTIPEYLEQLREALRGADPAMVQDALYDAEEYLRSELSEQAGRSEAEVIASVAGSYGAPEDVAGVAADPYTYGSLFYMLLAMATGTFYFSWVVTGASLSLGLMILIVGIPLLLLFLMSVRLLSLVEGRIVEVLLGVRMPRRPLYTQRDKPWLTRLKELFTDWRTWTAMGYLLLMLPLGTAYFSAAVTLLALSAGLIAAPVALALGHAGVFSLDGVVITPDSPWLWPLCFVAGVLMLFATLHLARLVGRFHGWLAKQLLVRDPVV